MKIYASILFAKFINFWIKTFKVGNGSTWPGHLVLKFYPDILKDLKLRPQKGLIFISGTNGKTTTTKMIVHTLKDCGVNVTSNESGANLLNGVLSALLINYPLKTSYSDYFGVVEVDEFVLPKLLEFMEPDVLVLLNLSRDQLDRYGEVDTVAEKWLTAVKKLKNTILITDFSKDYFQDFLKVPLPEKISFDDVELTNFSIKMSESFNLNNLKTALTVIKTLGFSPNSNVSEFSAAYGRGENIQLGNSSIKIYLAKNPVSFNSNLKALIENSSDFGSVFIILNDNIPDGRDVSWIYDIESKLIFKAFSKLKIYISGTRCFDMAARLDYAGITLQDSNVSPDVSSCFKKAVSENEGKKIVVLPNYSAMLDFRKQLLGKKIL